jgi:hypothetical protein
MTALHSSNINLKKNEDSTSIGITQEHQKTNDYSTELHGNLKQLLLLYRNYCVQTFLQILTPTAATDYSLWKTTKKQTDHKIISSFVDTSRNLGRERY